MDLSTKYMGLNLKNPIIVGSCGLTGTLEGVMEMEENGAGAVVLKSLFEEQITMEISNSTTNLYTQHTEANDYFRYYEKMYHVEKYIDLIKQCKSKTSIPIIASINCRTADDWTTFAKKIEKSGADGLELNIFLLPSDSDRENQISEQLYIDIIRKVKENIKIPIALKIGYYFTNLATFINRLSQQEVEALVLFNRFFSSDIDIDDEKIIIGNSFSTPIEYLIPLRWIALLSDNTDCDLCATTGIHSGKSVIKQLLAGAQAVQMVSSLYLNKSEHLKKVLSDLENWMATKNYKSISDFRGKLSQSQIKDPSLFERVQFMKYQDATI
ncbi:MAG: dihydroorotate dehydrogenase-like protein [Candidatus Cloacimonetes bacterium]|nr:dihydroorotate dehydrogenase-like protein [Candidatus Cloacimonadota bacterium]